MRPKRGDIALVYFPHSDLTTIKLRPVLIIQKDDLNTGLPQLVVAMISSNLRRIGHPSRVLLRLASRDAQGTGLLADSVVMTDNLATIELQLIHRRIGRFRGMPAVDDALRSTLEL